MVVEVGRERVAGAEVPLVELQPRGAQPLPQPCRGVGLARDDDEQAGAIGHVAEGSQGSG